MRTCNSGDFGTAFTVGFVFEAGMVSIQVGTIFEDLFGKGVQIGFLAREPWNTSGYTMI